MLRLLSMVIFDQTLKTEVNNNHYIIYFENI